MSASDWAKPAWVSAQPIARGAADDEQDRAGERRGLDQDRQDALPVEAAIDDDADDHRIDHADGRDLGRGGDAGQHRDSG